MGLALWCDSQNLAELESTALESVYGSQMGRPCAPWSSQQEAITWAGLPGGQDLWMAMRWRHDSD